MVLGVSVEGGLSKRVTFHDFPPFRGRSGLFCFRPSIVLAVSVEGGLSEMGTFHDFPPFRGRSGWHFKRGRLS